MDWRYVAGTAHASATEIGTACATSPGEGRAHLVMLESMRSIAGRSDKAEAKPRRVYVITA